MGLITNNNLAGVHFPSWEQMPSAMAANSGAGSCLVSDGVRYIYYLISATNFQRICTWTGVTEQLPNPLGGTVGAGTCMCCIPEYDFDNGLNLNYKIYALVTNGSATPWFGYYNVLSGYWTACSITNLPSTFGTDGSMCAVSNIFNNDENDFTNGPTHTITLSQDVPANAMDIFNIQTLTSTIPSFTLLNFGTSEEPKYVQNFSGTLNDTTITLQSFSSSTIPAGSTATYQSPNIYLIGNNSTQMYRYQVSTNTWSTTSVNEGNPALKPIIASGVGCNIAWLPGNTDYLPDNTKNQLQLIFGGNSGYYAKYNLDANNCVTGYYSPGIEKFTIGSQYAITKKNNKNCNLICTLNGCYKFNRFNLKTVSKVPIAYQDMQVGGANLVGNKMTIINQCGIDYLYIVLPTSSIMLRHPITIGE